MENNKSLERAIDPYQYDNEDTGWENEAGLDSPRRMFFWEYLNKYVENWKNKDVIDIGAGTGWLVNELRKHGVKSVKGVEPSNKNVEISKELYPETDISRMALEDIEDTNQFDVAILNMVVSHIQDLDLLFNKLNNLLRDEGEVYMTALDYDYVKGKHEVEEINESEFISAGRRSDSGTIYDIVRKIQLYIDSAEKAGFKLLEQIPMKPTEALMDSKDQYRAYADIPITHLIRFAKAPEKSP